ncbi:MAG: hypothetical protein V1800_15515 [Candidatus Latescibacterota bacterium]
MKMNVFMSEEKLIGEAIDTLMDKLGAVETSRFLSLPRKKRLESLKRHQLWQSRLEKDRFLASVFGE